MRFSIAINVVALAVLAAASPHLDEGLDGRAILITRRSQLTNDDGSVNSGMLKSHLATVRTKLSRGFDNYEANMGVMHPADVRRDMDRKRGAGVSLTDYQDRLWYGTVLVGTPPQNFTVMFDTGSSDLIVPSTHCIENCGGHNWWDPTSSSTAKALGQKFGIKYGDGDILSGDEYTDTVSISGFTATNQTLGAATSYSSGFNISVYPPDGILGMAFQSISSLNASSVFETLVTEQKVNNAVFSFKVSSSGAELYIGGSNRKMHTGNFTYTPVTRQGYWEVNMDGLQVDGKTILRKIDTIIDTGSTLLVGPSSEVSHLYKKIGGKPAPAEVGEGFYTFPCDSFPNISLAFGGKSFPIPASSLILGPVAVGSSDCVSGLTAGYTGGAFWIIGDTFLRGVYTKFDYKHLRVGFAKLA